MDLYSKVPTTTLSLSWTKWFDLPREGGSSTKVIFILQSDVAFVVVAYTIIVTLIFAALLQIVHDLALAFFPMRGSGNRNVMLIAFYNSANFTNSLWLMLCYVYHALFDSKKNGIKKVDGLSLKSALVFISIALIMIGCDAAAKFFVGKSLVVGNMATASSGAIFFPELSTMDFGRDPITGVFASEDAAKIAQLRMTSLEQAAGHYSISSKADLKSRVSFDFQRLPTSYLNDPRKPEVRFTYSYNLTGFDMGILNAPTFRYIVRGTCRTDYSQLWRDPEHPNYDMYNIFEDKALSDGFPPELEQFTPPFVHINPSSSYNKGPKGQSFSIIPHTAGRVSIDENNFDPWYMTEVNPYYNETTAELIYLAEQRYRVARDRPPFNCSQIDRYRYNGHEVWNAENITSLPGIHISKFLGEIVLPYEFSMPPIINAVNMGILALESNRYFFSKTHSFQASKGSIAADFERFVSIAFLHSREVVRNTALLYASLEGTGVENMAEGLVAQDRTDVLLKSGDASALSVATLLAVPIICVVLWIIVTIRVFFISAHWNTNHNSPLTRLNLRSVALQATQLYCTLDETVCGERKWSDRLGLAPYIKDQTRDRESKDESEGQELQDMHTTPLLVAVTSDLAREDTGESTGGEQAKYMVQMRGRPKSEILSESKQSGSAQVLESRQGTSDSARRRDSKIRAKQIVSDVL